MRDRNSIGLSALLLIGLLLATGCRQGESTAEGTSSEAASRPQPDLPKTSATEPRLSGDAILARMVEGYRRADRYADSGELYFLYEQNGEKSQEGPYPYSVSIERPGKLRLHLYRAMVVSDGETIRAAMTDVPNQVLETPAPKVLTPSNFATDEFLLHALSGGVQQVSPPPLDLMLGEKPLASSAEAAGGKRLQNGRAGDRECFRVELPADGGAREFWIDRETFVLRRLDIRSEAVQRLFDPEERLSSFVARVELEGAKLDGPIDKVAFQFEVPEGAHRLRRFIPPVPAPPTQIGEQAAGFAFLDLQGQRIDRETLEGKIAVFDFWFTSCQPCQASMPIVQSVFQKYRDNDRVVFYAVSIDDPGVEPKVLQETIASWGASLPIVRDLHRHYETTFKLPGVPAQVLIGADGRIQTVKIGPMMDAAELENPIERLLAGEDVAAETLESYDAERQRFEIELARASVDVQEPLVEILRTDIAPRTEPVTIRVTQLWKSKEVEQPGNILIVEQADRGPRVYVIDGWRTIVEVDGEGQTAARHELSIPEFAGVTFLRTATDADGKRWFVASGSKQQQLFVFDESWELKFAFPEGKHEGIADVQIDDLDGDGTPELLVGYWGAAGLQAVTLEGERLWSNRTLENVLQIAVTDQDSDGKRGVLGITTRGTLAPVDYAGKHQRDYHVPNRAITNLVSADIDGDQVREYCGLAAVPGQDGKVLALGFTPEGKTRWTYDLPSGFHESPIERIIPVRLSGDDGGWLLPGPDGSIHLLTNGGALVDSYHHGAALTGLAITPFETGPVLFVSTPKGLTAWKIEPAAE